MQLLAGQCRDEVTYLLLSALEHREDRRTEGRRGEETNRRKDSYHGDSEMWGSGRLRERKKKYIE